MLNVMNVRKRANYAYDGEALAKERIIAEEQERVLRAAEERVRKSQSKFIECFSEYLHPEATTLMQRLERCFEIRECAGNAANQYDGSPPPESFGPKTPTDVAIDAGRFIQRCERAVVSQVQPKYVGAWRLLSHAVENNLGSEIAGKYYTKHIIRDGLSIDGGRKRCIRIISLCGDAIFSEFRG